MKLPGLPVPNRYALVAGAGDAESGLNAFDRALQAAEVGQFNLVKVTSILPPRAVAGDVLQIPPGAVVYAAIGSETSPQRGLSIAAAVAVGVPADANKAGVIMEGHFHCPTTEAEERVRAMALQAMMDRELEVERIESVAVDHNVVQVGAVIAAVLLWKE